MYIPYLVSGDVMLTSLKSCRSPVHVTLSPCCRETPDFIPPEMWPSDSPDLNPVDYSIWGYPSREGLPFADLWCEGVERTSAEGVEAAIAQWRSRLNVCVRVNGGHFEHKFWASNFLLCFVCFIDTDSPKCDRYKHVQSTNIVWNVLLLCRTLSHGMVATQRMCGRKFLRQWLWQTLPKLCTKNYENPSIFVKVTAKKINGTFLCGHGVQSALCTASCGKKRIIIVIYKNLAIANRSRVSCA